MKNEGINKLFDDESKIEAFDFFFDVIKSSGFGSLSKADYDLLVFSIIVNKMYKDSDGDYSLVSNYNISKLLEITQTRVASLKEKKEIIYPSDTYKWQDVFRNCLDKCYFDGNNIKVQIPDRTTFLELKNIIEIIGGFVEVQLTSNLLCVKPGYFLKLVLYIYDDKDAVEEKIIKAIKDSKSIGDDISLNEFEKTLKKIDKNNCIDIFECLIKGDISGAAVNILKTVCSCFN